MHRIGQPLASPSHSFDTIDILGRLFGTAMWLTLRRRRQVAIEALRHHLELSFPDASRLARENFQHTGRSFLELFMTRQVDHRFMHSRVSHNDPENFNRMRASDRAIIAATGHLGAWELMAGVLRLHFQGRRSQIIVKQPENPVSKSLLTYFRSVGSNEIVHKDNAAPAVLRCLIRDKGLSAFLVDHNAKRSKSIFLPFLNELASVNIGPAVLAVRAKALVWPIFFLRNPPGGYILHSLPALDTKTLTGSMQSRIEQTAAFYTQSVEKTVRSYPQQWFWMHKRWRTRPLWEKNAGRPPFSSSSSR